VFRRILIANRGEIAVRIAATCHRMGIVAIAVYSEADRTAMHVRVADEAYSIGPAPAAQSYLNIDAVIDAARRAGAEALHPGYGFLSENPALAVACRSAGIDFIGPDPAAMRALGSKIAARQLAMQLGIPTVPGYDGDDQSDERLAAEAARIGLPLLIKAAAGGGGRGMRPVFDYGDLLEALAAARREAQAAFGDATLFLERLIESPRHVEIQVLGDQQGAVVHLGERECSIQRRYQKVIEEAPSPAVTQALRESMGHDAVRLAEAAGYSNAGTVEFILAPNGNHYFLEVNTRLQVEHPVTEAITGLDLVEWQIRVAAGEPLPITQCDITLRGHAIECRLYAEDATAGFLPSTGYLSDFDIPDLPGLRLDAGVAAGDEVGIHYDPLLAKLIATGTTRDEAVERLAQALVGTRVRGVTTNLSFLQRILAQPDFRHGLLSTDFIHGHALDEPVATSPPVAAILLAILHLVSPARTTPADPWHDRSHWRIATARPIELIAGEQQHTLRATQVDTDAWHVDLDGTTYHLAAATFRPPSGYSALLGTTVVAGDVTGGDGEITVKQHTQTWTLRLTPPPRIDTVHHYQGETGETTQLTAPMPGTIRKVYVQAGDRVEERQRLLVLEAMKMEHLLEAPYGATVQAVHHLAGDTVRAGEPLIALDATTD
jgi:3-methylcrotonyl-CoA carboxylase alpha subunit